jgi:hypothetical protein
VPPADFSLWQRATLERFARQAADENRELRERVRLLEAVMKHVVELLEKAATKK